MQTIGSTLLVHNTYSSGQTASAHVYMSHVSAGGSISSGEPERDAVYVVPDWVRARLQSHEQVWRSPEKVPRDREGEAFLTGFKLGAKVHAP